MARAFTYYGAPHRRVVAIPNGVDLTRFRPVTPLDERSKLRYELGIDVDDQVLLFAGNICYRKGVDVLIAAWQQITQKHPKARLLLVGSRLDAANLEISPGFRNQDFIDQIDEAIRQSARPERVVFCGNVPDIERYMRAADIFVFPSRMEGMPNVIPEAMASGLATIMTPFDALPREFGRPGQEFMLVDRTAEDLASAVNTLLEDTNRLRTYAHAGREWMEKNMDIEISLDCYAELYRSLAQKQYPRKHGEW
jgi:glycosyltransferase involved in cell wall biosynthesis